MDCNSVVISGESVSLGAAKRSLSSEVESVILNRCCIAETKG
jgi:hypothetical protein